MCVCVCVCVCLSVIEEPQREGLGPLGLSSREKKEIFRSVSLFVFEETNNGSSVKAS